MDDIQTIFSQKKKPPVFPGTGNKLGYEGNINFVYESPDRIYHNRTKASEQNADALENPLYSETFGVERVTRFECWKESNYYPKWCTFPDAYLMTQGENGDPEAWNMKRYVQRIREDHDEDYKQWGKEIYENAIVDIMTRFINFNDFNALDDITKLVLIDMQNDKIREFYRLYFNKDFPLISHRDVTSLHELHTNGVNGIKFSFTGPVIFKVLRLLLFFIKWIPWFFS